VDTRRGQQSTIEEGGKKRKDLLKSKIPNWLKRRTGGGGVVRPKAETQLRGKKRSCLSHRFKGGKPTVESHGKEHKEKKGASADVRTLKDSRQRQNDLRFTDGRGGERPTVGRAESRRSNGKGGEKEGRNHPTLSV